MKRLISLAILCTLFSALCFGQKKITPVPSQKPTAQPKPQKTLTISQSERDQIIKNLENNMVFVKGGAFTMGANNLSASMPEHPVEVSDFFIGRYEVTQEEWYAVTGNNLPKSQDERKLPAVMFDWEELQAFLSALNQKTGKTFRLPTEAEWEWAAQGGANSGGFTYSGSNDLDEVVAEEKPVGSKKPNELGIYDMSGNVWEICSDYYAPFKPEFQINPTGPSVEEVKLNQFGKYEHVMKGGDWLKYKEYTYLPQFREKTPTASNSMGVRLALDFIPSDIDANMQATFIRARQGNLEDMKKMAEYYHKVNDKEKNLTWLNQIASKADSKTYYQLGQIYREGTITEKNLPAAEKYLTMAYAAGNSDAKTPLGEVRNEIGLSYDKTNPVEALKWFIKGAEVGNPDSQNNVGLYYSWGKGTQKDKAKSLKYFQQAAEQNYHHALYNLGLAYHYGDGVPKDLAKAESYYLKAVENGNQSAKEKLNTIGKRYLTVKDSDDNEPLIGCTVIHLRNGKQMTAMASDIDGVVMLRDLQPGDCIRLSYVGYKAKEITLKGQNLPETLEFYLSPGNYKKTDYETKYY